MSIQNINLIKKNPADIGAIKNTPETPKPEGDIVVIDEENINKINDDVKVTNINEKPGVSYNLDDMELKKISLDKNICVRIINNINGTFVDIRKYYKGYPTKRGIRFSVFMFKKIIEYLKDDLK